MWSACGRHVVCAKHDDSRCCWPAVAGCAQAYRTLPASRARPSASSCSSSGADFARARSVHRVQRPWSEHHAPTAAAAPQPPAGICMHLCSGLGMAGANAAALCPSAHRVSALRRVVDVAKHGDIPAWKARFARRRRQQQLHGRTASAQGMGRTAAAAAAQTRSRTPGRPAPPAA